ncbi:MAG: DUF2789 domain-containing protein [Polynucleobacter sp.]
MESPNHPLKDLFSQLGLASDISSINEFIKTHSPLANGVLLSNAPFWKPSQAAFLRDESSKNADWSETVDLLNALLR